MFLEKDRLPVEIEKRHGGKGPEDHLLGGVNSIDEQEVTHEKSVVKRVKTDIVVVFSLAHISPILLGLCLIQAT